MFNDATIFITGGTGSWGIELTRQLLQLNPKKVIIFSRNEQQQVALRRQLTDTRLYFYIGDIRDREALLNKTVGVDYIFHLAALKHVPVCEQQPLEAIKTNVLGTHYVIEAAIENKVKKVIYVSTDKAADPANTYGFTKALGEKLMRYSSTQKTTTQFITVRGGNVLGSSGSVIPLFQQQIKQLGEVHVTDVEMVRYFITVKAAVEALLTAAIKGENGDTFVMKMEAMRILDLAKVLIEHSGKPIRIVEIGRRQGEKLTEVLIAEEEMPYVKSFDEQLLLITTEKQTHPLSLNTSILSKQQISDILKHSNLL